MAALRLANKIAVVTGAKQPVAKHSVLLLLHDPMSVIAVVKVEQQFASHKLRLP
jgi:hypothetical protein